MLGHPNPLLDDLCFSSIDEDARATVRRVARGRPAVSPTETTMTDVQFIDQATGRRYTTASWSPWAVEHEDGLQVSSRVSLLQPGKASMWTGASEALGISQPLQILARELVVDDGAGAVETILQVSNGVVGAKLFWLAGTLAIRTAVGVVVSRTVGPDPADWTGAPGTAFVLRSGERLPPHPASARAAALLHLTRDAHGLASLPLGGKLAAWCAARRPPVKEVMQYGAQGSPNSIWYDDALLLAVDSSPDAIAIRSALKDCVAWSYGHRGHHFFSPDGSPWTSAQQGEPGWDGGWRIDPLGAKENGTGGWPTSSGTASYDGQHLRFWKELGSWLLSGDVLGLQAARDVAHAIWSCHYISDPIPVGAATGGDWRQAAWIWKAAAFGKLADPTNPVWDNIARQQLTRAEKTAVIATDSEHTWFIGLWVMGCAWLIESPLSPPDIVSRARVQLERGVDYVLTHAPATKDHVTPPELHVGALVLAARIGYRRAECTARASAMWNSPDNSFIVLGDHNYNGPANAGWLPMKVFGLR